MRLRRFEIRNFKGIASATIDWDDLLIFIGENNSGKSSILNALATFLSGSAVKDRNLFHRHQTDHASAIELVGHFDNLTAQELDEIAVRGRTVDDRWILKKKFWFEADESGDGQWREMLYSFSGIEQFQGWPASEASWGSFPADYQPLIDSMPEKGNRPNVGSRESLKDVIRRQRPEWVSYSSPRWIENPGGGGNWKSNANSILPRCIFVRAVQEASDETKSKDASTYGKLINLIVERSLASRPELGRLREALDDVLALFRPSQEEPERQAEEIRDLQGRINASLNDVIGGTAVIRTEAVEVQDLLLPSTSLVIHDVEADIETDVVHQGHGLQRSLVMTLLQMLSEAQVNASHSPHLQSSRGTVLLIEEPELYLHPQMERLMRDVIYRLSSQEHTQVAVCTHSPVFLDVAERYRSIVRTWRSSDGGTSVHQVREELFPQPGDRVDKKRLQTVARFHPTVNELFFAKSVVLLEEASAIAAFERGAELIGLFDRVPRLRREVTLIDCDGKYSVVAFQRVLNAFGIVYRVIHDADSGAAAEQENERIASLLPVGRGHLVYTVQPTDLESMLGYISSGGSKPYRAVCTVERLHSEGALPEPFIEAIHMVYLGNPGRELR
ncbi:ATP-dependent endonuclease [Stenotrophomonas bentonitica]|uniref:ATP-dependent nuclease n=1 Tax=Stenotrophomonas bentonitica TaxID=1450134 RepID=UPI00345E7B03